ncbi:hypothetical protein FOCC_FOCC017737, partial [Frankliniella occidentalis]
MSMELSFFQPKKKKPQEPPSMTAKHSHELYVIKMSMRRTVPCDLEVDISLGPISPLVEVGVLVECQSAGVPGGLQGRVPRVPPVQVVPGATMRNGTSLYVTALITSPSLNTLLHLDYTVLIGIVLNVQSRVVRRTDVRRGPAGADRPGNPRASRRDSRPRLPVVLEALVQEGEDEDDEPRVRHASVVGHLPEVEHDHLHGAAVEPHFLQKPGGFIEGLFVDAAYCRSRCRCRLTIIMWLPLPPLMSIGVLMSMGMGVVSMFMVAGVVVRQSAPDVRTMLEHEGSHVDELRRLYCKFCSTWFPTLELLDGHVSVTHPGRRHACAPCGLAFPSAALADKHARDAHRGRHLYACACGAAFDAPSELYRHATETLHMMEVKDASKFHDDLVPRRANTSGLKMLPMDRMAQLLTLVKDVGCLSPRLPNTPPPLPGGGAQTKQPAAQQPLAPKPAPPSTQPPAEARFVARPLGPSKPRILSKSGPKPPQCRLPTQLPARPSLLSPDARPLQPRPQLRPSQHPTLRLDPQPFPGAGPLPPSPPRADLLSPPRVGLLSPPRAAPQPPLRADPPSPPRADLLSAPRVAPQHPPRVAPQPPLRADPP